MHHLNGDWKGRTKSGKDKMRGSASGLSGGEPKEGKEGFGVDRRTKMDSDAWTERWTRKHEQRDGLRVRIGSMDKEMDSDAWTDTVRLPLPKIAF